MPSPSWQRSPEPAMHQVLWDNNHTCVSDADFLHCCRAVAKCTAEPSKDHMSITCCDSYTNQRLLQLVAQRLLSLQS